MASIIPDVLAASSQQRCLLHVFPSPVIRFSPASRPPQGLGLPPSPSPSGLQDSGGSEENQASRCQFMLFLAPLTKARGESAAHGEEAGRPG